MEDPVHMVERAWRGLFLHRGSNRIAPDHALKSEIGRQSLDRAARDGEALAQNLVRLRQFTVLAFESLQLRGHVRRHAGPLAGIDLTFFTLLVQGEQNRVTSSPRDLVRGTLSRSRL